jgi:hypothetical protein
LHTLSFEESNNYEARGLDGLTSHLRTDLFLIYGLILTAAMLAIIIQPVSIIRHAFYESFLHLHQILVVTAIVELLLHCESQSLPQQPSLYGHLSVSSASIEFSTVVERRLRSKLFRVELPA